MRQPQSGGWWHDRLRRGGEGRESGLVGRLGGVREVEMRRKRYVGPSARTAGLGGVAERHGLEELHSLDASVRRSRSDHSPATTGLPGPEPEIEQSVMSPTASKSRRRVSGAAFLKTDVQQFAHFDSKEVRPFLCKFP
ncbi:unnamed protein product, partial [Protopolystoma xenopodis]